jgi:hypothetical protein
MDRSFFELSFLLSCGGSVATLVIIIYHAMVSCLPALFMAIISKKINTQSNSILHADKRTYRDRTVVIPCPDFLYSTVNVNLTSPTTALLFTAPVMVYGSLGLYDDMARCVDIANHSHSSLRALIIGPQVIASDEQLHELYPNTRILRLASSIGLLLHRYLMPSPETYPELRHKQLTEISCEVIHLPKKLSSSSFALLSSASLPMRFLFSLLWSPATVLLTGPLLASLASLPSHISISTSLTSETSNWTLTFPTLLSLLLLTSLLLALPLVLLTLFLLKKPSFVMKTGIMTLSQIDLWKFNTLEAFGDPPSSSRSSLAALSPTHLFDPFRNLVFFLHGALGLTPKEVQYGGTLMVHSNPPSPSFPLSSAPSPTSAPPPVLGTAEYLRYDGCYAIDVPSLSLDLSCEWWSLTLYGHDLFLLPTQQHLYSTNSYQLQHIHSALLASLPSPAAPAPALPPITYRILSSAEDPKIPPLPALLESFGKYLRSPDYDPARTVCLPVAWIPLVPPEGYQPQPQAQPRAQEAKQDSKLEDVSPRFILRAYVPSSMAWLQEMRRAKETPHGIRLPSIHRIPGEWIASSDPS